MKLTSSKAAASSVRKKQSPPEREFEKAWNRVVEQQKKNAMLREEVQVFSRKVSAEIQEHEKALLNAKCQTCEHLLSFFSRKSLTQRERAWLIDWILDHMIDIGSNPFSAHQDFAELRQRVDEQLAKLYPRFYQEEPIFEPRADQRKNTQRPADDPRMHDMFEDMFAEFDSGADNDDEDVDPFAEALFGDFEQQRRMDEESRQAEEQALKEMMKASSISRMFRKVARVLHPDRERDENAREDKNRLMGELLHARQTNDIPAIFSLYAEHVGESPLQELTGDLKGVTKLLQRQYQHLCDQKENIINDESPSAVI